MITYNVRYGDCVENTTGNSYHADMPELFQLSLLVQIDSVMCCYFISDNLVAIFVFPAMFFSGTTSSP